MSFRQCILEWSTDASIFTESWRGVHSSWLPLEGWLLDSELTAGTAFSMKPDWSGPGNTDWFQLSMQHFTFGSPCHGKQLLKMQLHGLSCLRVVKTGWGHWVQNLLPPGRVGTDGWGHDHRHQHGYQSILSQICLPSQDIESQMSPSDHLCPWFYSFDPWLILRRRAPLSSAPWCQSQLFSGALNVCIHLKRHPCGGSGGLSGEKCLKQSLQVNSVVLRDKAGWLGFSGD